MRYLSVCSGIESATVAWHPLGWEPVAFAEIDRFPSAVLAYHYPEVRNLGDFTQITRGDLGADIDLLVGGTPCQDFSLAGKRLGLDGARGNLAIEFCRLARRLRPRWIVWENVPGVHSNWSGAPKGEDLEDRRHEWIGDEDSDFGAFLDTLEECGYSSCWRVLDTQYVRVESHPRAAPQRRERVFVVGYLGDWRPPAAALFEPEGLRGDTPPRREAGQGTAPTLAARTRGGGGLGTDFDLDVGLIANTLRAQANDPHDDSKGPYVPVSHTLNAKGGVGRLDYESETLIAFSSKDHGADAIEDVAPTLRAMAHAESHANAGGQLAVAHTLKGGGFDGSEDGTGRGTPIVPVGIALRGRDGGSTAEVTGEVMTSLRCGGGGGDKPHALVPFDTTQITSKANRCNPQSGDPSHPLAAGAHAPAIAFRTIGNDGAYETGDVTGCLNTGTDPSAITLVQDWAVRRLTPLECERLMAFPDGYTAIPYRGKIAADGPRYKALGNSMSVNVMSWVGQRIDIVDRILKRRQAA